MSSTAVAQGLSEFFSSKSAAKNYEIAERATGPPARALLQQIGLSPGSDWTDSEYRVLDNACGTGIVTATLYEMVKGKDMEGRFIVVCGDLSGPMVEYTKERTAQFEGLEVAARELNGEALDLPSSHFTHALTNFGFQSFPNPISGLRELIRVTKPGGTIGMTNWIDAGWTSAFRVAVSRIAGAPRTLPDPLPFMVRNGKLFDVSWTLERLEEIQEVDNATIQIEEHSFTMVLKGDAEVNRFIQPLEGLLHVFTLDWSREEQEACGNGKLLEGIRQAILEEPNLVWRSLVTTAQKRI
ncbi:hypothetical protein GALMADRAFT_213330 [Galerina marginata CBS 339.88]|uniref:Methyltransferase domain-containing protein n=1 Tax=Galerina marginata (strain CBS 339.88) TaxID=685588 RepID=A0A067SZW5_GALM3|nr:hypothetical protein GALMADRAFT_213330 [Galerina marginata CBS 339.88]